MSAIVGGWRNTKKIGRDDEAIERDRMEAVSRRKELNRRKPRKPSPKSSLCITYDKSRNEDEFPSWVRHPCEKPKLRKYRVRESTSPQRELFPKKRKKRRLPIDEFQINREQRRRPSNKDCRLCERCGRKFTGYHNSKSLIDLSPSTENISRRKRHTSRKRSRTVITPEQKCKENCSPSELQAKVCPSRRRRSSARVLRFGDEKGAATSRFAKTRFSTPNSKDRRYYNSSDKGIRCQRQQKSKQRKLRRDVVPMKQLGPFPDFARSAKCLYEFIRRPKQSIEQENNTKVTVHILEKGMGEINVVRTSSLMTTNIQKLNLEDSTWLEPSFRSQSITKMPNKHSGEKFEFVQSLLVGENGVDTQQDPILDTSKTKLKSGAFERAFSRKSTRNSNDSVSEATVDANAMNIDLSTYESAKESRIESQWGEDKKMNTNTSASSGTEGKQQMVTQQQLQKSAGQRIDERQSIFRSNTFTSAHGSLNMKTKGNYFTQEEENGGNASPSQTPSTAPSAMLSLPMNDPISGLTVPSFEESRSSNKNAYNGRNFIQTTTTAEKDDPLRDIGFWKRVLEKEESKRKSNSDKKSFKYTIASLIIAKNPTIGANSDNCHNDGFLWLPSMLEGGLAQTGLFEE